MKKIIILILLSLSVVNAQFSGGSGTALDPYQIATALQLDSVRNHLSSDFILTADIDLSSYANWIPIGFPSSNFGGYIHGDNHLIKNLTLDSLFYNGTNYEVGLFRSVGSSTIDSLTMYNCNVRINDHGNGSIRYTYAYIGLLSGQTQSSHNSQIHFLDCEIIDTLSYHYNNGIFISPFGYSVSLNPYRCSSYGLTISHVGVSGNTSISGLCASLTSSNYPNQCFVDNTTLKSNVPLSFVCGLAARGNAVNCWARATIDIPNSGSSNPLSAGIIYNNDNDTTKNCYSVVYKTVDQPNGFVEYYTKPATSCYYDSTVIGSSYDASEGGTTPRAIPKSTSNLQTQSTFVGWDFTSVWGISSVQNGGLPYLRWNNLNVATAYKRLRVRR